MMISSPRAQRTGAAFVRVARLFAPGHDGVCRCAAHADDGRVDLRSQPLAGEHGTAPEQFAPGFDAAPATRDLRGGEHLHPPRHADLRDLQRPAQVVQFLLRLVQPRGPEHAFLRGRNGHALSHQRHAQRQREAVRHDRPAHAAGLQEVRGHHRQRGLAAQHFFMLLGELRDADHLVHARRLASAVHFQVAEEHGRAAVVFEEHERVGREELRRIENVGAFFTGGDDEPGRLAPGGGGGLGHGAGGLTGGFTFHGHGSVNGARGARRRNLYPAGCTCATPPRRPSRQTVPGSPTRCPRPASR